jgi:fatty acid CoA ligase FadD9
MKDLGLKIHAIREYSEWFKRFEQGMRDMPERLKAHSMLPLIHSLSAPLAVQAGSTIPSDKFRSALAKDDTAPSEVPQLNKQLISRYLADLQALDLVRVKTQ